MKNRKISQNEKHNFAYRLLVELIEEIRFKFDSNISSIYLPFALAFVSLLMFKLLGAGIGGYDEPLWLAVFTSAILAPINEEILCRGLLFGVIILASLHLIYIVAQKKAFVEKFDKLPVYLIVFGIMFQGVLFGWLHENDLLTLENHNWGNIIVRSFSGIVSGALFYYNRKNLFPCVTFHASWNLLVILSNPFVLF